MATDMVICHMFESATYCADCISDEALQTAKVREVTWYNCFDCGHHFCTIEGCAAKYNERFENLIARVPEE